MTKSVVKISLFIIGLVAIVLTITQLFLSFYYADYLKDELKSEFSELSASQYTLDIDKLCIKLIPLSVRFSTVTIQPNFLKTSSALTYQAAFDEIELKNISLFDYILKKKKMSLDLGVVNPSVSIYRNHSQSEKENPSESVGSTINNHLVHRLILKTVTLTDVKINLFNSYSDTIPSFSSTNNKIVLKDFTFNKKARSGLPFAAQGCDINLKNFKYQSESGMYAVHAAYFRASYADSIVSFRDIALIPLQSKDQFAKDKSPHIDRYEIAAKELNLLKINVKAFFETGNCTSPVCEINKLNLVAYRDVNKRKFEKPASSPQSLIRKIPFYINIDSIKIDSSFIAYEELAKGAKKSGEISFQKVKIVATGLTNDSLLTSGDKAFKIKATAMFMNSGKMNVQYSFPLNTHQTKFECNGELDVFPLKSLNKILKYNANILIKEGVSDKLIFSMQADDNRSTGWVTICYSDLKVELLKSNAQNSIKKNRIGSFLLNTLISESSGASENDPPLKGKIDYERNPDRFVFYYTWRSILDGLKSIL